MTEPKPDALDFAYADVDRLSKEGAKLRAEAKRYRLTLEHIAKYESGDAAEVARRALAATAPNTDEKGTTG